MMESRELTIRYLGDVEFERELKNMGFEISLPEIKAHLICLIWGGTPPLTTQIVDELLESEQDKALKEPQEITFFREQILGLWDELAHTPTFAFFDFSGDFPGDFSREFLIARLKCRLREVQKLMALFASEKASRPSISVDVLRIRDNVVKCLELVANALDFLGRDLSPEALAQMSGQLDVLDDAMEVSFNQLGRLLKEADF